MVAFKWKFSSLKPQASWIFTEKRNSFFHLKLYYSYVLKFFDVLHVIKWPLYVHMGHHLVFLKINIST